MLFAYTSCLNIYKDRRNLTNTLICPYGLVTRPRVGDSKEGQKVQNICIYVLEEMLCMQINFIRINVQA